MRFLPGLTAAVAAVSFSACSETTTPVLAQFLGSEGEAYMVTARGEDSRARRLLVSGNTISSGQTVETSADGTALVALLPNVVLRLNGATAVSIDDVRLTKNGNSMTYPIRQRLARVRLHRGSLYATTPQDFAATSLQISAGAATISATEWSAFLVALSGDTLRLTNPEHRVVVAKTGGRRLVDRGYYFETSSTGAALAGDPRLIVVDEEASEQAALVSETRELVDELTGRLRDAPAPWTR